ncbi:hypothetical protein ASD00_33950 [Ensifer sp. Root31]|uniref:ABC transporter permease n=1 Tax=Ensifer sp. Root31 TaxID=1736512 RepID=UPI000709FC3B|nr:ABC transporter permease [Ensifer sp. Root31]KQU83911.1 hypothetical protein ASD00_33950 [Ensifer sp. Root31]
MFAFVLKRILVSIPTLLVVYTVTFVIAHFTPGSPWDSASANRPMEPAAKAALDAKYNLDAPLHVQYVDYLWGAVQGDLGPTFRDPTQSVTEIVKRFLPTSLGLGSMAMAVSIIIGLPLGIIAALTRSRALETGILFFCTFGVSVPTYIITAVLIVTLGVGLGLVPTFGWQGLFSISAIVPVISLALAPMAAIARYSRNSVLEVMHKDFIRSALAKGVQRRRIITVHILRNALVPVVTVAGSYASSVLVGSFFVESIAGVPGFGRYFVLAVSARDYPVIIATTLVYAVIVIACNLIVDVAHFIIDPRTREDMR